MEITLATPALLFPAVSLLMLAYTNRFLAISTLIRSLKEKYVENHEESVLLQIKNLRTRVFLIRNMQMLAVFSLFCSVLSMFLIYANEQAVSKTIFGIGLVSLCLSLALSLREIQMSVIALNHDLKQIEEDLGKEKHFFRILDPD